MLLRLAQADDRGRFESLVASGAVRQTHDRIDDQLTELARCLHPERALSGARLHAAVKELCAGTDRHRYGTWVWYPWSGRLVHVLPEAEFRRLRADRNRDKITAVQQRRLRGCRIGVIGLSVGNSAALTCAMEGVGGSFRLADFDQLGLSNLNRLRAGVHDLGLAKTVLCARQMYETDPYLDIELWQEGITEDNLEAFFGAAGRPLDLLIEECDTTWVKVAAREHARGRRVPVLMDMNDRGMLDVERFDQEPARPLFHGRAGDITAQDVRALDPAGTLAFLLQVCDTDRLSPAMSDALGRIGSTLSSWPQLASGVQLGGALVTDTARRILLGEPVGSGRYYVDLEALISPHTNVVRESVRAAP
ncbi:ThiF family adenylyltransferase [Streptomyces kunmingensis]|uniref:ThiF family adenylyltransferase n=1 Tax=Streptomyces kunmingensis TaxID=68225 RepID=A0ABU6CHT7_9ACTN|nr:ThiF family adenylyltransferase [Streptomyces kunmingensis]MEB3964285.1 ThiF family adenylyltransferase [Streptomyces kunmingensis]